MEGKEIKFRGFEYDAGHMVFIRDVATNTDYPSRSVQEVPIITSDKVPPMPQLKLYQHGKNLVWMWDRMVPARLDVIDVFNWQEVEIVDAVDQAVMKEMGLKEENRSV